MSGVLAAPYDLSLVAVRGGATRPGKVLRAGGHIWERRSAGSGSKGRRTYDWAVREVTVKDQARADGYAHHLLTRRSKQLRKCKGRQAMHEIEYFFVHAPEGTAVPEMIRAAGLRWKIEQGNQTGKDQLGLDHYPVRKYTPWYRHTTLAMLAAAFLTVTHAELGRDPTAAPGQRGLSLPRRPPSRALLAATVLARLVDPARALARDLWRQLHQDRALISHYCRRGDPLPQELGM